MKPLKKEKYKLSIKKISQQEYEYDYNDESYISQDLEYNDFDYYCLDDIDDGKKYYNYIYIPQLNTFSTKIDRILRQNNWDEDEQDYDIFVDKNNIYYFDVFTHTSESKKEAFFGCVLKTILIGKIKKKKILKIYDIIKETYPEIYFKLIGRLNIGQIN